MRAYSEVPIQVSRSVLSELNTLRKIRLGCSLRGKLLPLTLLSVILLLSTVPRIPSGRADAAVLFEDGFESGDFSKWTGTSVSAGASTGIAIGDFTQGFYAHHGVHYAHFDTPGGADGGSGGYEGAYCYKSVTCSELYARGYFDALVGSGSTSVDGRRCFLIVFSAGSNNLAYAGWRETGGVIKWCLTLRQGTGYVDVYSSTGPKNLTDFGYRDYWYSVELHWRRGTMDGGADLWVDGKKVCSSWGVNTAAYGDATSVRFGLPEVYQCYESFDLDCTEISTAYIGPEPKMFQDGCESGDFSKWSGKTVTSGETASIDTTQSHDGRYSAKVATNGGGDYERAYCYESIAPVDALYARGYYVSQSGISEVGDSLFFIVLRSGSDNVAYAGWKMTETGLGVRALDWCLTVRESVDGGYADCGGPVTYSEVGPPLPLPPSLGRWFCVELFWERDISPTEGGPQGSGSADLYVDGILARTTPTHQYLATIAYYHPVSTVRFGLGEAYGAGPSTVYVDSCAVDSTVIGTEEYAPAVTSSLSISVSRNLTTPRLGTTITGSLTPESLGSDISIIYRLVGSGSWNTLATVKTNASSAYSYDWAPSQVASYELKASWAGNSETLPANSSVLRMDCRHVATRISISTSSSTTGLKVNATGRLLDEYDVPLKNEAVVLNYHISGVSNWALIVSDTTDSSGDYFITWIPSVTGYFSLRAEWAGNATYSPANITTTVNSVVYNQQVFSVESNSSTTGLAFNETDLSLKFSTSGPDGTKGYARVFVAKSLMNDPLNAKVYVDGIDKGFEALSQDDSWLLFFDYSQSTHQIVVDLDVTVVPEFPALMILPLFMLATIMAAMLSRKKQVELPEADAAV